MIRATVWQAQINLFAGDVGLEKSLRSTHRKNPLFTVSSTEKTDKIRIPSALPLRQRQCNCGEFYLVSKLAASTTGTIWSYQTDILYSTVAIAAWVNAKQASSNSHCIMSLKMLMLMAVSCSLTENKTKCGGNVERKSDRHRCNTCQSKRKTPSNPQNRERSGKTRKRYWFETLDR